MKFLTFLFVIWLYRLISNIYYFYRLKFLSNEYEKFWTKNDISVREYNSEIIDLFKKANIKDKHFGDVQPMGLGMIQTGNVSLFNNLFVNDKRIVTLAFTSFDESIGVYKQRLRENFNPIFWIECFIYLPKNIFKYLGLKDSSIFVKISQILYWVITVFYTLYNEQINKFIQDFLSSLFK